MSLKKILLSGLSVALVAAVAIGGTLAYLQDDDSDVNVMTLGNVFIEQHEYERVVDENGDPVKGVLGTDFTENYGITESYKLQKFTQGKPAYPAVYTDGTLKHDEFQQLWNQVGAPGSNDLFDDSVKNVIDKFVFVENTGTTDAYYRTLIAIECPEDFDAELIRTNTNQNARFDWSFIGEDNAGEDSYITVDGVRYFVKVATYNQVLTPGEVSRPSLLQLFLDPSVTNEDCALFGETWDVLVFSQAVQADGFTDAQTALDTAFGDITTEDHPWAGEGNEPVIPVVVTNAADLGAALADGGDAILNSDIEDAAVDTKAPYGNYYGVAQNGGVFDGNGNTLDFDIGELHNSKADNYGIMTSGGTIKNVTITGVFRGIVIMDPTEDIYIDNVTIGDEDVCYAINTAEGDGTHSLYVSNSTIKGWSSYGTAIKDLTFTNCTFAQGEYYTDVFGRLVKPYVDTVFENCEFNSKFYIDLSQLGKDGDGNVLDPDTKIVLKNCTVNGVTLTAENWTSLVVAESDCGEGQISIEGKDGSYMSASNVFDYVIIE